MKLKIRNRYLTRCLINKHKIILLNYTFSEIITSLLLFILPYSLRVFAFSFPAVLHHPGVLQNLIIFCYLEFPAHAESWIMKRTGNRLSKLDCTSQMSLLQLLQLLQLLHLLRNDAIRCNGEAKTIECALHYYFVCLFATVRAPFFPPQDSIGEAFRNRAAVWWLLSKFVKACQNDDVHAKGASTPSTRLLFSRFSSVAPRFFLLLFFYHYPIRSFQIRSTRENLVSLKVPFATIHRRRYLFSCWYSFFLARSSKLFSRNSTTT